VQAAAAGLRWAISFAHQHLLFHPLLPDRTFDAFIRRATSVPST
jgi:hypothetical protein